MSTNKRMDKQIVPPCIPCCGIVLSEPEERTIAICNNVDRSHNHDVGRENLHKREDVLYDLISTKL